MITPLIKTIRPTHLQPKIYSVINKLSKTNDYKVIIDKDNNPMCYIVSYSLLEDIDLESKRKFSDDDLEIIMKDYYSVLSKDESELLNDAIDDWI